MNKTTKKAFLKANWRRLASSNYIVDPEVLTKYIPKGTVLETHEGKNYVSLVAFRYCETRLYNVKVPYHTIFEEINLRFYVKREISPGKWRSEVAFTKLFFPKKALTLVAKLFYKENYETRKLRHRWSENDEDLLTSYGLRKDRWHEFDLKTSKESAAIDNSSSEAFFSKHYWGTAQVNDKSCTVYKIEHPEWKAFQVKDWEINFDFGSVFGADFMHLNDAEPESVQLLEGSEVTVFKKKIL